MIFSLLSIEVTGKEDMPWWWNGRHDGFKRTQILMNRTTKVMKRLRF